MNKRVGTSAPRLAAVLGLMLLSPICAEYLIGYGESTSRPLELLTGLLILAPLYGTIAVLLREIVRRTGRGWPTILLLSAAFGVIQAGLVDQSLFFREVAAGDPDWATEPWRTIIPGTGVDATNLLIYVGGHVIWSFAAPIAVVEACAGRLEDKRWLGPIGLAVMALLWIPAAALIFSDAAANSTASTAQLVGAAVAAAVLIAAAFVVRPERPTSVPTPPPSPWLVGAVAVMAFGVTQLLPGTWVGVVVHVVVLLALGRLLLSWSRRDDWGPRHVLAVAGAALVVRAGLSLFVEPLGEVDLPVKYAVNAVTLVGVVVLLAVAARRLRHRRPGAFDRSPDR